MRVIQKIISVLLILTMMLSVGVTAFAADDELLTLKNGSYKNVLIDTRTFGHSCIMGAIFKDEQSFADVAEQAKDDSFAELSYVVNGKTKKLRVILREIDETYYEEYDLKVTDALSYVDYTGTVIDGVLELKASDGTIIKGTSAKIKPGKKFAAGLTDEIVIYNGSDLKEKFHALEVGEIMPQYAMGALVVRNGVATQVVFNERVTFEGGFVGSDGYYVLNNGTHKDVTLLSVTEESACFAATGILWGDTVTLEDLYKSTIFPDCLELSFTAKNKTYKFWMYNYGTDYLEDTGEYIINGQTVDGRCPTAYIRNNKINLTDNAGNEISGKSLKIRMGMRHTFKLSELCTIYNGTDKKEKLGWDEVSELMAYAEVRSANATLTSRFGRISSIVIQKKIKGLAEMRKADGNDISADAEAENARMMQKIKKSTLKAKPSTLYDESVEYVVTTEKGVIRNGAHTDYKKLGNVYQGEIVNVYADTNGQYGKWYFIETENGMIGWVSKDIIRRAD